jgi:hypothetical protein
MKKKKTENEGFEAVSLKGTVSTGFPFSSWACKMKPYFLQDHLKGFVIFIIS